MDAYNPLDSAFDNARRGAFYKTGQLRRSTLVALRWMAVLGQTVSLLVVHFGLGIDLPIVACGGVIAVSALVNLAIMYFTPREKRVANSEAGVQLLFDCIALAALLYLTGGMHNPFALLLLAPVVVSAKTLDIGVFVCLAGAVAVMSFLLLFFHLPLPWFESQSITLPRFYLYGAWAALLVGMLFTSSYTWRTTAETRRITQALAATDAILAHEQKLSALGGLAAAAAHKLGTPLSTIQLVAKEIENGAKPQSPLAEDAVLLRTQADNCREILMELGAQGDLGDEVYNQQSLSELLREITEPFMNEGKTVYQLMDEIQLPEALELTQEHGMISWGVKSIWEYYATWFHFNSTTELYTVPVRDIYAELSELVSSEILMSAAQAHFEQGNTLKTLHYLEIVLEGNPDDNGALKLRLAALEKMLENAIATHGNSYEKDYLRSRILVTKTALGMATD